jgi:purine-binding chemotaxis protein CheW
MRVEGAMHILEFAVDGMRHALCLSSVEKVEYAVEVSPLPESPRVVIGVVNWRGRMLPVLSMRRRLHLPERSVMARDRMIIARSSRRWIALMVDEVSGVHRVDPDRFTAADALSDGLGCVTGVTRTEDGIVLILDLELFLTEEDEKALGQV